MQGRSTMQGFEADLRILDLDVTASEADIRQAYRDLVMVWHPDRFDHNPRLRQKAEAKLKLFNQAYTHLKEHHCVPPGRPTHASESVVREPGACEQKSRRSRTGCDRHSSSRSHPPPDAKTPRQQDLEISLEDAQFILNHFPFQLLHQEKRAHSQSEILYRQYQGGPFVLVVCDSPPEVMLSVPCSSLHAFDRILLTIPCKSAGHFVQQEAEQLLQCLYTL